MEQLFSCFLVWQSPVGVRQLFAHCHEKGTFPAPERFAENLLHQWLLETCTVCEDEIRVAPVKIKHVTEDWGEGRRRLLWPSK